MLSAHGHNVLEFSQIFVGHFLGLSRCASINVYRHGENLISGKEVRSEFPNSSPRLPGWQLPQRDMSDKKRTTVTTIETHEVWIIRRIATEPNQEAVTLPTQEIGPQPAIPPLGESNNTTNEEGEETTK
jgi:hypothetical protein